MTTLPDIDFDHYGALKQARAEAFELCEHLEGCIEEGHARIHQARMGFDNIEAAEAYLQEQIEDYDDAEEKYYDIVRQIEEWNNKYRGAHANWVWDQEALRNPIHKTVLGHGPRHPTSYLLYDDGGNLIFQRDEQDRYTSYTFWLEHITHPNPIELLGRTHFSARELRIAPSLLDELYQLETDYIKSNGQTPIERIQEIRAMLKVGYELYKFEKVNSPL
jgi:hypothetical protein